MPSRKKSQIDVNSPEKLGNKFSHQRHLWLMGDDELQSLQVTKYSLFSDVVWRRGTKVPGQKESSSMLNWGMVLHDGSTLNSPQHVVRLDWARKLTALLLHHPSDGVVPAESTMIDLQIGFKWLLSWMVQHGYHLPEQLTEPVVDQYLADLPGYIADVSDEDEFSPSVVFRALKVLRLLWTERSSLARWGIPTLTVNPFYEHGLNYFAKRIATKAQGWIPPLPDEVAVPLFNKAEWFLGGPAEDVIHLVEQVVNGTFESQGTVSNGIGSQEIGENLSEQALNLRRVRRSNRFLERFQFRTLQGDDGPWHGPLGSDGDKARSELPLARLRILFDAIRDACAILIQGTSGMRISELLGIEAGFNQVTGLPTGVRIESSATGLYEIFLIRSVLSKTEVGLPREVDWLLGIRPIGSTEEPIPVRALRLLNRLHAPFRASATTTRLILQSRVGETLPLKDTALGAMNSDKQRDAMKRFIARWVDLAALPNESKHKTADNDLVPWRDLKGSVFKTHMLRKTWAQFVFAVHPELMPAISLQFHHLTMAMSDGGYIGNNPLIVQSFDEVHQQQQVALLFETVMGRRVLAGKMGEHVEKQIGPLAEEVRNLPTSEAYRRVVRYCDDNDLKIFFSPHGKCMPIARSAMRCHEEAGSSALVRLGPNPATRQASLCVGCDCFVLDVEHASFWKARYVENETAYRFAERSGNAQNFSVIKARAQTAGKLLKKLGISLEVLDKQVLNALHERENGQHRT